MKKLSKILTPILLITAFLLVSCKDDVVTPPPPVPPLVDTVDYYNWYMDSIWFYNVFAAYVADTNSVFLEGATYMVHYDGVNNSVINYPDPNYRNNCISGYGKNTVYLGGSSISAYYLPQMLIWRNSSWENIMIPPDSSWSVSNIYAEDENNAWLAGERYKLYHYQSGFLSEYEVDSLISYGVFYKNPQGILYFFSFRGAGDYDHNFAYKFNGSKFVMLSIDSTNFNTEMRTRVYDCGRDVIRQGKNSIFVWENEKWIKLCETPGFGIVRLGGTSRDSLVGFAAYPGSVGMFLWDGKKWAFEKNFEPSYKFPLQPESNLLKINGYVFMNCNYFEWGSSFLIIGKPKNLEATFHPVVGACLLQAGSHQQQIVHLTD